VVGAESAALPEEKLVIEDAVRSHAWIFDALGELVAATPSTPRPPQRTQGSEAAFRLATTRRSSSTVASRRGIWASEWNRPDGGLPHDNCKRPLSTQVLEA
jgi:hypothetical protein